MLRENLRARRQAGGRDSAARRVHARRLLLALLNVCRHLRGLQPSAEARAAGRDVERELRRLLRLWLPRVVAGKKRSRIP